MGFGALSTFSKSSLSALLIAALGLYAFGPDGGYMNQFQYHNYRVLDILKDLHLFVQIEILLFLLFTFSFTVTDTEHDFSYWWTKLTWCEEAAMEKEAENKAKREARKVVEEARALRSSVLGSRTGSAASA